MNFTISDFHDLISYLNYDLDATEIISFDMGRDRIAYWSSDEVCHARHISSIYKEMKEKYER